ncbi:MAG TPA: ABC transporter transmembrane domain-containing protein [Burkholderiaceae bacterium]|nr:ABC transporter transmembrane domain-containing protein [Burkholderiaceae bacterium]
MPDPDPDLPRPSAARLAGLLALLPWLRPYLGRTALATLCLLAAAAATLAVPVLLRDVVDAGIGGDRAGRAAELGRGFLALFGASVVLAGFTAARYFLVTWLGERVIADVRSAVYARVLRQSPVFFETTRTGEVLSRLTADTTLVQTVVGSSFSMGLRNAVLFAGSLGMLVWTVPRLAATVLALLAFVVLPALWIGRRVRRLSRASQDRLADTSAIAAEVLNAIPVVQSHGQQEREARRFGAANESAFAASVRRTRTRAWLTAFVIVSVFGSSIFGLYSGSLAVLRGEMTAGELGQTLIYFAMVASSAAVLAEVWGDLLRAAGATERLDELLRAEPAIRDPERPAPPPEASPFGAGIEFRGVRFHYPSRPERPALHDLTLRIAPGRTVALVGPSGAGKSTVLQLLLRFYERDAGQLRIDGLDIERWPLEALRARIALVPQDATIFSADAMENIRYARPGASEDEVIAAARAAQADGFLRQLPQGYRTFLGERGLRLSGGQRQRIAIARAVLKDAPLLLLDEATSALDTESERLVQQALETAMRGRTTIVVAHRLSTVQRADLIVVLDHGRVAEQGTHAELLARGGLYSRLAGLQLA